jgi:hypothetical protein
MNIQKFDPHEVKQFIELNEDFVRRRFSEKRTED